MSHHSKNLNWRMDQCYSSVLFGKERKIHPRGMRAGRPKRYEEKRGPRLKFVFSFYMFFSPPPEPALKAMAPNSSTLAWKILWMDEPGGLPSMGSHRVRHNWSNLAATAYYECLGMRKQGREIIKAMRKLLGVMIYSLSRFWCWLSRHAHMSKVIKFTF